MDWGRTARAQAASSIVNARELVLATRSPAPTKEGR
jgi:hypothetical protein